MHHVTYLRPSDRTRIVFVSEGSRRDAERYAAEMAPLDFRPAAYRFHEGGRMHVPADGDDYSG